MRKRGLAPERGAWGRMLRLAVACSLLVLIPFTLVAFLAAGQEAARSVIIGGGLVIVLYAPSIWVVDQAERRVPQLAIPLYMLLFVLKFLGVGIAIATIPLPVWLSLAWGGAAGVTTVVVWQAACVHVFSSMRMSIVPQENAAPPPPPTA